MPLLRIETIKDCNPFLRFNAVDLTMDLNEIWNLFSLDKRKISNLSKYRVHYAVVTYSSCHDFPLINKWWKYLA